MNQNFETVIGLEVHVQLLTETKVFCGCSTKFGAEPNTHVCPVCLGMPGVLPVLNQKAFEYSIKVAFALKCDIQKIVKFDRKNYYYPDLPKNFQISQFDMPVAYSGKIEIITGGGEVKEIRVTRAHLEEDAGKLIHDPKGTSSYVDLNRTGTPLLEIVSEPELTSPEDAYDYLITLKQIIKYLEVSDCNMEEGSLRCDANISIRKPGEKQLGTKVEIKNLNSFKAVKEALAYERERQEDVLEDGGTIVQETRLWNEKQGITESMRAKEKTHDYRYFPEPDLVPFEVSQELVEEIRLTIPEMPDVKKKRFEDEYQLGSADIDVLTAEREQADFFEEVVRVFNKPKIVCNWVRGEVMMHANEKGIDISTLGITPAVLAEIIKLSDDGKISGLAAKDVLKVHIETGKMPEDIVKEKGLEQMSDTGELDEIVKRVIFSNERSATDYKNGKTNALSYLIGQVMKESKGKANPKIAGDLIKKELG